MGCLAASLSLMLDNQTSSWHFDLLFSLCFSLPFPVCVLDRHDLKRLNLADNNFSGEISPGLNNLVLALVLHNKKLSRSIFELKLPKLHEFNISNNSGYPIPQQEQIVVGGPESFPIQHTS
ncbi:hypothetical protein ACFX2J_039391 [Malus domestica]